MHDMMGILAAGQPHTKLLGGSGRTHTYANDILIIRIYAQMGGGGNMMMNSGMIPIGAHGPSGPSGMVPVGGMPQNNRHMNPMQGDFGGVRQFCTAHHSWGTYFLIRKT